VARRGDARVGSRLSRTYLLPDIREDWRALRHPRRALGELPKRDSGHPDLAQTWLLFQSYWRLHGVTVARRNWLLALVINLLIYLAAIADLDLGPTAGSRIVGLFLLGSGLTISYVLTVLVIVRARRLASGDYEGRFYVSPPDSGTSPPPGSSGHP
jgi:hypothetical protein